MLKLQRKLKRREKKESGVMRLLEQWSDICKPFRDTYKKREREQEQANVPRYVVVRVSSGYSKRKAKGGAKMNVKTKSFIVGENIPIWAKNLGAVEIRNPKSGKLEKILIPSGVGDGVVSANVGGIVAVVGDRVTVVSKELAKEYKM